ncbi:MAG: phosphoglycerate kinase [Acidobacteria bacterium]|nr:phosphoglycerate kinase [Acidobacteriota bacterium]
MTNRTRTLTAAVLGAGAIPGIADAHLVNTGFGPFYDGISHLFVTAPDILVVVALGLLAGLRGPTTGRTTLAVVIVAWTVGGLTGLALAPPVVWAAATTVTFLALGAALAVDREVPTGVVAALGLGVGLLHGFLNGAEAATSGIGLVGLAGSLSALAVMATLITALAVTWAQGWTRIVVRVAGSWITAIGILMLGWLFRPGA